MNAKRASGGRSRVWRTILTVAAILAVAGIGLAVAWRPRRAKSEGAEGPFFKTVLGPLSISVIESGTISPREQLVIKSEIEGSTTILSVVPEGTRVRKDDMLVELDVSGLADARVEQEIRVQNAEALFIQATEILENVKSQSESDTEQADLDLRFAREDLTQYRDGQYPNALKEHEAQITMARENVQRAREKLGWSRKLFEEKYLAESEMKADEMSVTKAELDVELAVNRLGLLKEFTYKRQMTSLDSNIRQSERALDRVRRKGSSSVRQAEVTLRARESEYRRQKDRLNKIVAQIAKGRILAPREGLVVYASSTRTSWRGNVEPLDVGQQVRERQELLYLPTTTDFLAEIKVHESNLEKVRVGLPVRITVDALGGMAFDGRVLSIAPLPDATSVYMNPDLKLYRSEILIDGGGDAIRTGMSCQAEILVERHEAAVYVPVQCVVRVGGRPTVYVKTADGVQPKAIEIGLDNNVMVHVTSGLEAGEEVSLTPPLSSAAKTGERVARRERPVAGVGGEGRPDRAAGADRRPRRERP